MTRTDQDIARICAEALGIEVDGKFPGIGGGALWMPKQGDMAVWNPLTDAEQNRRCLWWLMQHCHYMTIDKDELLVVGFLRDCTYPCSTPEELSRAICLALCDVYKQEDRPNG